MSGWTHFRDELPPDGMFWVRYPGIGATGWGARHGDVVVTDDGDVTAARVGGEPDEWSSRAAWHPYTPGEPAPEWVEPLPRLPDGWEQHHRGLGLYHHPGGRVVLVDDGGVCCWRCVTIADRKEKLAARVALDDLDAIRAHAAAVFARDGEA